MCNCSSNPCGCDSGIELPYLTGAAGSDGIFGGFSAEWKFDNNTTPSPSSTYVRVDNAAPAAITKIYVHINNIDGTDHDNFLNSFTNGGAFGLIRLFKEYDSNKFWLGQITAVTDNTTYYTLDVTYILHNGIFAANENIVLTFTPKGATGATGSSGSSGTGGGYVVDYDLSSTTTPVGTAPYVMKELTVPANTVTNDGDILEFFFHIERKTHDFDDSYALSFGNLGYLVDSAEAFGTVRTKFRKCIVKGKIIRQSNTTAFCSLELLCHSGPVESTIPAFNMGVPSLMTIHNHTISIDWTQINLLQFITEGTGGLTTTDHTDREATIVYIPKTA